MEGNGFYFILFSFLFFWGVYHRSKSSKLAQPKIPGSISPTRPWVRPPRQGRRRIILLFQIHFRIEKSSNSLYVEGAVFEWIFFGRGGWGGFTDGLYNTSIHKREPWLVGTWLDGLPEQIKLLGSIHQISDTKIHFLNNWNMPIIIQLFNEIGRQNTKIVGRVTYHRNTEVLQAATQKTAAEFLNKNLK